MDKKSMTLNFNKERRKIFYKKILLPIFFVALFITDDIDKDFELWREILFSISILIYIAMIFLTTFTEEDELRIF
ncbi:MAG: hypothetical protein RSB70_06520 [Clostridium sp.]